jgi:hypothetical protein
MLWPGLNPELQVFRQSYLSVRDDITKSTRTWRVVTNMSSSIIVDVVLSANLSETRVSEEFSFDHVHQDGMKHTNSLMK